MAAAGKSPAAIKNAVGAGAGVIKGVGLSRAAGLGGQEMEEAAEDERYLRKVRTKIACVGFVSFCSFVFGLLVHLLSSCSLAWFA